MVNTILKNLKKHDPSAQELYYKKYAKTMFLLCYRYLNNEEDASEIVNDGFYKVFNNIKHFREGNISGLLAWTRKIMINECLQHLRKRKTIHFVEVNDYNAKFPGNMPDAKIEAKMLYEIIREMPDKYRLVFNLHVVEGYSHKEIAEMLKIKENTSRSHLLRAREILKNRIKNVYNHGKTK
jgi:RNA polymerase sigma-70 factor (ECF subfamily)